MTDLERMRRSHEEMTLALARFDAVASERWHQLKACEKLNRQLEKSLRALLFIAKTDKGPVHSQLRRDIREAEKVLEIVASVKRERRRK